MTKSSRPQRRGLRTALTLVGAAALTITTATTGLATPDTVEANADDMTVAQLAPGEISKSKNIKHLANLPIPDVLAGGYGTDLAFQDDLAFIGSYNGFWVVDVSKPSKPKIVSTVLCPGGQADITVDGDLLFLSVDAPRTDDTCSSEPSNAADPTAWEGMRIFDISNVRNPRYVAAVQTDCGSHTHTLVPGTGKNKKNVYLYVSSYGPRDTYPNCQPPHDSISIVEVPVASPHKAKVVAKPDLFAADGGGYTNTSGCHDITAYPEKKIAAGACMGDGIILDIKDPVKPKVVERVRDTENFAFWHSATFSQDADKVVFTDELGGGGAATCLDTIPDTKGANAIYDLSKKKKLSFTSYFKIPRDQGTTENCVAHNGSLIPVKGKDIMVQAWYQGGLSVWDFTKSNQPEEFAYFERGPISEERLILGGAWSTYYYNGHIYSSDITEGLDVLKIDDKRTKPAEKVKMDTLNVQTQPKYKTKGH